MHGKGVCKQHGYRLTIMRKALTPALVLAVIMTLGIYQREVLAEILTRLTDLPRISLAPLAVAAFAMVCARGFFLFACSPGVTLRQAVIADQTALAAGYGIAFGGGLVGTGMRIHMFTTWNISHLTIASSIITTAVVPSFTTWGLPCLLLIVPVIRGTAALEETLVVGFGVPIISISFMFWWFALRSSTMFSSVGRLTSLLRSFLIRKVPSRYQRLRALIERLQPLTFSVEMRNDVVQLLRNRWKVISAASASTLAASFICLWMSSVVFKVEGLAFSEAVVIFSLIRVIVALSPIPGGTGIAEIGLVVLLERAGVNTVDATGMTVIYRLLTWFTPIVVGSALWWRYNRRYMRLR